MKNYSSFHIPPRAGQASWLKQAVKHHASHFFLPLLAKNVCRMPSERSIYSSSNIGRSTKQSLLLFITITMLSNVEKLTTNIEEEDHEEVEIGTDTGSLQVVVDEEAGLAYKDQCEEKESDDTSSSTREESSCTSHSESDEDSCDLAPKDDIIPHEKFEYPSEFCCPLSHQLFSDPVVAADGESYERSAYRERHSEDVDLEQQVLYPNRALKMIIDDAIICQSASSSFQASFKRLQYVARKAMGDFLDPPTGGQDGGFPLSDGFYCPITFNIIHSPVIDPDGNSYEQIAVENWIRLHGTSPVTRNALTIERLYPNHAIRRLLEAEKQKPEDQIHPDILKWKEEPEPKASDLEYGGGMVSDTAAHASSTVSQPSSVPEERMRRYRRRLARRQLIYNLTGIVICFLLLKFVHSARK